MRHFLVEKSEALHGEVLCRQCCDRKELPRNPFICALQMQSQGPEDETRACQPTGC